MHSKAVDSEVALHYSKEILHSTCIPCHVCTLSFQNSVSPPIPLFFSCFVPLPDFSDTACLQLHRRSREVHSTGGEFSSPLSLYTTVGSNSPRRQCDPLDSERSIVNTPVFSSCRASCSLPFAVLRPTLQG
jgi:hypothetical protein